MNGAGRGRIGVVCGCPLGTALDSCEWHASGAALGFLSDRTVAPPPPPIWALAAQVAGQPSGAPNDPAGSPRTRCCPPSLRVVVSVPRSPTTTPKEDAMIVADVSFTDIFWSILWFYFLFLWIMV